MGAINEMRNFLIRHSGASAQTLGLIKSRLKKEVDMREIWLKKAEDLEERAKTEYENTGRFNAVLVEKAALCKQAAASVGTPVPDMTEIDDGWKEIFSWYA